MLFVMNVKPFHETMANTHVFFLSYVFSSKTLIKFEPLGSKWTMKQIKYLTFCRFILYLYKHAVENKWLEWFTKRFSRWIIYIQDVCNISYVPKSFIYIWEKKSKRQRKTDYVSELYSNLNYVNFKGLFSHPCKRVNHNPFQK